MRKIHVRTFAPPGLFTPEAFFELLAGLDADLTVDVVEMGLDGPQRDTLATSEALVVFRLEVEAPEEFIWV
ncbi:MAG: hypothetical protein ACI36W_06610 [Coriobacteriales bacterium]